MASRVGQSPWLVLQLALSRVERSTLLALVLCLAAGGLQWVVRPQVEARTRAVASGFTRTPSARPADDQELLLTRYHAFQARLADRADREEVLRVIFAQAAAAGVSLPQGDYSVAHDADGDYQKVQVVLPVKGSYQQIRGLTKALLEQLPALAMDEISFRRETIKRPDVEAQLRLTLYLKSGR